MATILNSVHLDCSWETSYSQPFVPTWFAMLHVPHNRAMLRASVTIYFSLSLSLSLSHFSCTYCFANLRKFQKDLRAKVDVLKLCFPVDFVDFSSALRHFDSVCIRSRPGWAVWWRADGHVGWSWSCDLRTCLFRLCFSLSKGNGKRLSPTLLSTLNNNSSNKRNGTCDGKNSAC